MIPSRYMIVGERSPHPVKRRVKARRDERGGEPAVTLLPPDPYLIMERPDFSRSSSPTMYRTVPPKSAKDKGASSFVILGETTSAPVQSRPGSPSGRISPFRGHGFKSPTTTRPNSRAPSPSASPKKNHPIGKSGKSVRKSDGPRIGRDIGLPPKSPMKSKSQNLKGKHATTSSEAEGLEKVDTNEEKTELGDKPFSEQMKETETGAEDETNVSEPPKEGETTQTTEQLSQSKQEQQKLPRTPKAVQKSTPAVPKDRKGPPPLTPKPKTKAEKNEANKQESVIKKATKPPLPPKKVGLKASLKNQESSTELSKSAGKEGVQEQLQHKENINRKEDSTEDAKTSAPSKKNSKDSNEKETKENSEVIENSSVKDKEKTKGEEAKVEDVKGAERKIEDTPGNDEKKPEKLVPCFQPDKCQIAPPTMASPSPIITPTISTPSTTADLASSSIKSSQSIAAAPTSVTPSSLGSVSSTLVLTGNLARKEIGHRSKSKGTDSEKSDAGAVRTAEQKASSPPGRVSGQMVKAASKDSIKWSTKDRLSGEITSATKVIKAEPDMEVLSPNNLRDSPARIPPPNMAWDEGRVPNGDVPNKVENESKFRSFISALLRFFSYLFCCRCLGGCKCCRRPARDGVLPRPSIFSKLNCCKGKSCRNPFKCCAGCCKCCEKSKCCRRNPKPGNADPKPRKCCAKVNCSCKGCCDKIKDRCLDAHYKINSICRSLFCLNLMCCQKFLRKLKFCHKFKCCQKGGFCSCCNPNVKKEPKKPNKKGSRTSNNSRDKDNLDVVLVEHTSLMKAAIPVLPACLAVFCLILNLFMPGFGTFVSGVLCLCFGKPRFSVKDTPKNRLGSFILNTVIGVAQLFTVVFCLVGWGWSIWWGVIMYKLSRRQKRLKLAEKNQKAVEGSNVNHNHVDVEQG